MFEIWGLQNRGWKVIHVQKMTTEFSSLYVIPWKLCRYVTSPRALQASSIALVFIHTLKPNGNCMYHLLQQPITLHFVFLGFMWFSIQTATVSLNNISQLIFVTVNCGVLYAVGNEFLNIITTSFGFKGLNQAKSTTVSQ
jgi:hypothetical protein